MGKETKTLNGLLTLSLSHTHTHTQVIISTKTDKLKIIYQSFVHSILETFETNI